MEEIRVQYLSYTTVRLRCVKEGNKLRMKVITPGYISAANCQFPRDIRVNGCEYEVPKDDIVLTETKGNFFYKVKTKKNNIVIHNQVTTILQPNNDHLKKLKIYGDDTSECCICMCEDNEEIIFVIFAPCGHYCCCNQCAVSLKTCPLCRANINQLVRKEQLQI